MKKIIRDEDVNSYYQSAKDLAPFLQVSERQVHYYREHGKLKAEQKSRARYQFNKEDVISFLVNEWGFTYEQ